MDTKSETNKELLDQVIESSLVNVQDYEVCSDPHKAAFKEVKEAYELRIELERIEEKKRELALKEKELELREKEFAHKEKSEKSTKVLRYIEVIGIPLITIAAECAIQNYFVEKVCNFEKDYTFTTTPGRRISDVFNIFKRRK